MAIHALRWNLFHENVFASCGADWTVKIWDHIKKYVKCSLQVVCVCSLCLDFVSLPLLTDSDEIHFI